MTWAVGPKRNGAKYASPRTSGQSKGRTSVTPKASTSTVDARAAADMIRTSRQPSSGAVTRGRTFGYENSYADLDDRGFRRGGS